jgi:uncharacterized RDD family membrane protein YckC
MQWFYSVDDAQQGPVGQEEFDALVREGKIGANTMVWREGMADWVRYGDLPPGGLAAAGRMAAPGALTGTPMPGVHVAGAGAGGAMSGPVPVVAVHRCAECGGTFPETEMIAFENAWVCAACKPVFVQKLREGVGPRGAFHYAGFWIRVGAKFIDGIILQVINFCVGLVIGMALRGGPGAAKAGAVAGLAGFAFGLAYVVYFNGRFGATPGKMALRLKIVRPNGDSITYMRALGRYFGEMLSGLIMGIGFMMAGWDEEKRALHDRICDTRVIVQS